MKWRKSVKYLYSGTVQNQLRLAVSPYRSESGMYTYQIEYVGQTPGVWSKIKISDQLRNHMKAEVIIFPLH